MILSQIMKREKVSRDYDIEIDLTIDCEDMGLHFDKLSSLKR